MRDLLRREWLWVAALAIAALAGLVATDLTWRADALLYDAAAMLRPPLPSRVTIVAIDEASLRALGRWPWRRSVHARLLQRLAQAHPLAIGYDVLLIEPSPDDAALGRALGTANVVLPMTVSVPGENGKAFEAQLPPPDLAATTSPGHALLLPDADGVLRRITLRIGDGKAAWPAFAEQVYRRAFGHSSAAAARRSASQLPPTGFGLSPALLLPLRAEVAHPTVSFVSVLRGEVPAEMLRDRIVLVGSTAAGAADTHAVPGGMLAGVYINAAAIDALAADRLARPAGRLATFAAALVPIVLLLAGLLRGSPRANLLLGLALVPITIGGSVAALLAADIWLPPAAPVLVLILVQPIWAWRRLAAASAYLTGELARLRREVTPLPSAAGPSPDRRWLDDPVSRQTALLNGAVTCMEELRRFFAESLQALPDPVLVVDGSDRVMIANRAAQRVFGESVGSSVARLLEGAFTERSDQPESPEPEFTNAAGEVFVLRRAPLTGAGGEALGAILRFADLTAIRLADRQREDALRLLSHDMRAPQAAILALLAGADPAAERERIAGYARRTMRLAEEFVLLARAEAAPLRREVLDLGALLIEATDELWPAAHGKRISIATPEDVPELLFAGDRSLLLRVLVNLLDNAVRYCHAGAQVRCTAGRGDAMLWCRIADDGPGIAPDALETVFRPFERGGRQVLDGTGLGLAFVKAVVTRHAGTVIAANDPLGGAVFTLHLPAGECAETRP